MIEKMENLMLAIDKLVNIVDDTSEEISKLMDAIPTYLIREMVHPRKKPRGSIRRARKGVRANDQERSKQVKERYKKNKRQSNI